MGGIGVKSGTGGSRSQDSALIAGKPGEYTLYRAGEVERTGFVFLTTDKSVADSYSQGGERAVGEYKVQINNPLVIDGEGYDTVALRKAWLALHPGTTIDDYKKEIVKGGGMTEAKWKKADRQNAAALLKSPYDAVVYKNGDKVKEVWVHSSRRNSFR